MVPRSVRSPCIARLRARKGETRRGHLLCRDTVPTQQTLLRVQGGTSLLFWVRGACPTWGLSRS
eukprot:5879571-Pyramimonas_sp.AAC.1